jgi:hypothetical protein
MYLYLGSSKSPLKYITVPPMGMNPNQQRKTKVGNSKYGIMTILSCFEIKCSGAKNNDRKPERNISPIAILHRF